MTFAPKDIIKNMFTKLSFRLYIVAILLILASGFIIGKNVLMPYFYEHTIKMVVTESKKVSEHIFVHNQLNEKLITTNEELQIIKSNFNFLKIKVYDSTGVVTASTNVQEVGQKNEFDYFNTGIQLGDIFYKVVRKGEISFEQELQEKDVVEIYIPFKIEGKTIGAIEIYYDMSYALGDFNTIIKEIDTLYFIMVFVSLTIFMLFLYRLSSFDLQKTQSQQEIVDLNRNLKRIVKKRTNQLKEKNKELTKLLNYDHLTQVYSRAFFMDVVQKYFDIAQRHKSPLYCIGFDLDLFKRINDTYGHAAGDEVLKDFASMVSKMTRSSDIFGRIGGEEFLACVQNVDEHGVRVLSEKIRKRVENSTIEFKNQKIQYTVSIGVACLSSETTLDELIDHTDMALYEAKKSGRNQVAFYKKKPST